MDSTLCVKFVTHEAEVSYQVGPKVKVGKLLSEYRNDILKDEVPPGDVFMHDGKRVNENLQIKSLLSGGKEIVIEVYQKQIGG